jgi:CubicO group peptidase (beta-lactamase class C family)
VGGAGFTATTPVPVASASKWVYAAYVVQRRAGVPDVNDVEFLTLRSGYNNLAPLSCTSSATVDTCLALGTNGALTPQNVGKFYYDGGHMQRHAHDFGLGGFNSAALTAEVAATIGNFGLVYNQPQPAGGLFGSAADYAGFLRRMLAGSLQMSGLLGSHAVCTNPATCATAAYTPVPSTESWHYSLGHWVEDDPAVGDGAFSSAGAFGFYPWIDSTKRYYGVVSRLDASGNAGYPSAQCGRLVRKAWLTAVAQ